MTQVKYISAGTFLELMEAYSKFLRNNNIKVISTAMTVSDYGEIEVFYLVITYKERTK